MSKISIPILFALIGTVLILVSAFAPIDDKRASSLNYGGLTLLGAAGGSVFPVGKKDE